MIKAHTKYPGNLYAGIQVDTLYPSGSYNTQAPNRYSSHEACSAVWRPICYE